MVTHTHTRYMGTHSSNSTLMEDPSRNLHTGPLLYFPSIHTMLACRGLLDWQKEVTSGQSVVPAGLHRPGQLTSFSFCVFLPCSSLRWGKGNLRAPHLPKTQALTLVGPGPCSTRQWPSPSAPSMSCLSFSLISLLFPHLPSFLRSQPRKPSSSRPRRVDIPLGVPQRPLGFSPTLYPTSLQIGTNSLEEKEENVSKQ